MITKELIKTEIDRVHDRYLEILYKIIKAFEIPLATDAPSSSIPTRVIERDEELSWSAFIEETYGCLSDDPIERGDQGVYEIREEIR
jgi:hypothetical protein